MQDSVKSLPPQIISGRDILESEDLFVILQKLAVAILIGLLIGLEREHSKPEGEKIFAGIRTFPLISMLGFSAALISSITSAVVYAIVIAGFASILTASHIYAAKEGEPGGTSVISILIVFLLGSLVFWNYIILAAIIGVIVNLFLTLKFQFHWFVGKLTEEEIYATLKLAIISVIVFPLLPDRTYGPFNVLNPRMIWLMVMFIGGITYIGYLLVRFIGKDKGITITGLMGGLVSSTAVAVSLSRKSKENPKMSASLAAGIILASTVMYPRVLLVIAVLSPSLIKTAWLPITALTICGAVISWFILKRIKLKNKDGNIEFRNPFELKSALTFGVIFAAVIFASKAAQVYMGHAGIYAASAIAGITTVDAIVVSLSELSLGGLSEITAVAAIIIATVSNTIVKLLISLTIGAKEMRSFMVWGMGIITVISLMCLFFLFFF